jgi:hypothetical protein
MTRSHASNTPAHFLIVAFVAMVACLLWCLHRIRQLGKPSA